MFSSLRVIARGKTVENPCLAVNSRQITFNDNEPIIQEKIIRMGILQKIKTTKKNLHTTTQK